MKILMLTQTFPYPPDEGIKIKLYNTIKHLSQRHNVTLISFFEQPNDVSEENQSEMKKYADIAGVFPVSDRSPLILRSALNIFRRTPFSFAKYPQDQFSRAIEHVLAGKAIDVVHFDIINMAKFAPDLVDRLPSVMAADDSITPVERKRFEAESNLILKIYRYSHWRQIMNLESRGFSMFDKVYTVGENDRRVLLDMNPELDVTVIPNGVDCDYFTPGNNRVINTPSIVFVGAMSSRNNVDAAILLIEEIMPAVESIIGDVMVYLVGKEPPDRLRKKAKTVDNVVVTGSVDDTRPYVWGADVYVSPLQIGSGVKFKVLEAMAMGKAIVANSVSCAGIDVIPGEHLIQKDDPKEMAKEIVRLINNPEERKRLGVNARKFAEERLAWSKTIEQLEALYLGAIEKYHRKAGTRDG